MAQNEEAASAQAPAAPKSGGGNKLVFIILGMNVLMMAAVLFVVLRKPAGPAPAHAATPASAEKAEGPTGEHAPGAPSPPKPGPILKLENFVIQLRGVDQDRYVRVSFDIEVSADIDREAVQARLPQIRDSIITFFSDRTLDELRGSEGIERTKVSIMKRMEEIVPGRRVRAIYITDFIIQ